MREPQAGLHNAASLRVSTGPLAGPVLTRVVSMILARANCPVDRLDDAMLVCDALSAHAPAHTLDGQIALTLATGPERLELRIGALRPEGARQLVQDSAIPGLGNVLERVADEVRYEPSPDGAGEDLVLALDFAPRR